MYIPLIILSLFCVGLTESIRCHNCTYSNDDAISGEKRTCDDPTSSTATLIDSCDFCLVTTLYYDDSRAPIRIVYRQCGKTASLPSGAHTAPCNGDNVSFGKPLYQDPMLGICCYKYEYDQTGAMPPHKSNVTYCFCMTDECNNGQNQTGVSVPTLDPSASPNPTISPVSSKSTLPGSNNIPFDWSGNMLGSVLIPVVSTAVVSVCMILSAVCLWKMSDE